MSDNTSRPDPDGHAHRADILATLDAIPADPEALDRHAMAALDRGALYSFHCYTGAVTLGIVDSFDAATGEPEIEWLGEIEGYPSAVQRTMTPPTPGHVGHQPITGVVDVFQLTLQGAFDWNEGFGWVSWADKVPAIVGNLPMPYGLRLRVATAAGVLDHMIEIARFLAPIVNQVESELVAMAHAHTPPGKDSGDWMDALMLAIDRPLDQRTAAIAKTFKCWCLGDDREPCDLDGTPR